MTDSYLSKPLLPVIQSDPKLSKKLNSDVSKIRKHLKRYAQQISQDVDHITILDICDERGELLPSLLASIDGRPRKENATSQEHSCYSGQIISRIKKIVRVIATVQPKSDKAGDDSADLLAGVPEFLQPILVHLPRKCSARATPSERLVAPLTAYGRLMLKVLLGVTSKHKVSTLQALLIDYWRDLKEEYFAICQPPQARAIHSVLNRISRKLGFTPIRRASALRQEEIPPHLREQIEVYKAKAPSGAATDPELCRLALERGIKLVPLEESTITLHCVSLATLLARIPRTDDMEIADLIRMETKTVIEDDEPVTKYFNPLMDIFREQEKAWITPSKGAGYDSALFESTVGAVRAIAAYNGVLKYHKRFNKAYKPNLDMATRAAKKSRKKQTFSMSWVDFNLSRLKASFDVITRDKSFKTDVKALQLCMCYVYVMMLRYTGVRQQGLRICRMGWNIIFNKDGSITFHWRPEEIKNDKDFTKTVKPQHTDTFAPLVVALRRYYRCIYPYLVQVAKQNGAEIRGQFFLQVLSDGSVRCFDEKGNGAGRFSDCFKHLTLEFFDFTDVEPAMRGLFNAHHIRGIAGDWIHNEIGVGIEGTAKFLGDHRQTVEQEYLDKSRIDSTLTLDEANDRAVLINSRKAQTTFTAVDPDTELQTLQDPQIAALLKEKAELRSKLSEVDETLTRLLTKRSISSNTTSGDEKRRRAARQSP